MTSPFTLLFALLAFAASADPLTSFEADRLVTFDVTKVKAAQSYRLRIEYNQ